jgi:NADPH-dependent curcumin reductase CurA
MTTSARTHQLTGAEVRLRARPAGTPDLSAFQLARVAVPDPAPGQVLVRNLYLSLDPGMVLRMAPPPGLSIPGYQVGAAMRGEAIGEVIASADPSVAVGAVVAHPFGWREYAVCSAAVVRRVDPDAYPTLSTHLGFGLVAYAGLFDVGAFRPGDTVFVSSAAGATGSLAGQFARLKGAGRVVGSAGSAEKVRRLTGHLGFDAAFDYHDGPVVERLRAAAPDGIDVYFDNVGGEQLRAAVELMRPNGRIVLCGALAGDPLDLDLARLRAGRLTLRGFNVLDHLHRAAEFGREFRGWLRDGSLVYDETIVDGLANAPQALIDLVGGKYAGKVVVRV